MRKLTATLLIILASASIAVASETRVDCTTHDRDWEKITLATTSVLAMVAVTSSNTISDRND